MSRRADQSADNRTDSRRAKRDPPGVPASVMVSVVNDIMPRRGRRRAMRSMPPVMRRGNRRASRQRQSREKNRNRFDGLVHITPATFFSVVSQEPFSRLHKVRKHSFWNLTGLFLFPDSDFAVIHRSSFSGDGIYYGAKKCPSLAGFLQKCKTGHKYGICYDNSTKRPHILSLGSFVAKQPLT